jgi:hypothetical protein
MGKELNFYDKVLDELHKRRELVRAEVNKEYRKQTPFRVEPYSNDEMVYWYEQLNSDMYREQMMDTLIQKHGEDAVNNFIFNMEQSLRRRRGNDNR